MIVTLADRLHRLLDARGYSISEAAREAGMEKQQVWRIVTGKNPNPGWLTVERIIVAVGGSWADLLGEGED